MMEAGRRLWLSAHRCWACDVLLRVAVSLSLSFAVLMLLLMLEGGNPASDAARQKEQASLGMLLVACFFSPVVENGLLIGVMRWARFSRSHGPGVVLASAVLSALHGFDGWQRAIAVFPAFVVFALTYQAYQPRKGWAYLTSCVVHGMDNAVVWTLLAIDSA